MAILSRTEFGTLVGKSRIDVARQVKTGKLIEFKNHEGKFKLDTTEPKNRDWLAKWNFKDIPNSKPEKETLTKEENTKLDKLFSLVDSGNSSKSEKDELYTRKLTADTILQEKKIESEQLKIDKLAGELMPIDLVQKIVSINIQNVYKTMQQNHEMMASKYCSILAPGDREMISRIRDEMDTMLNDVVADTRETALLEIEKLIHTFSASRTRGQRK